MKIIVFGRNLILFLSLIYLGMLYFLFSTTGYSYQEVDENSNKIISIFELDKYLDTSKRYRCINRDRVLYFNSYPKQQCEEIILEYFSLKDGIEFRKVTMK